jgi:hypothetical protein
MRDKDTLLLEIVSAGTIIAESVWDERTNGE